MMNAARKMNWFTRLERSHRLLLISISLSSMLLTGAWYVWGYTSITLDNKDRIETQESEIKTIKADQTKLNLDIRESLVRLETKVEAINDRLDREENK